MRNFEIEKEMYRLAVELIKKRYPKGWGGAGVVHTTLGAVVSSQENYPTPLLMLAGNVARQE